MNRFKTTKGGERLSDEKLLKLLKSDPDRGMHEIVKTYSGLVWAIVRGRLRPPSFSEADTEECVADVFTEFWLYRERFDPCRGSIKSFLAKAALNNAYDVMRRARRSEKDISMDGMSELIPSNADAEHGAERAELISAIESLGKPDSEIIVRKYLIGQSSKEISERLRISVPNVDTRTHRAIKKLRTIIGGAENEG